MAKAKKAAPVKYKAIVSIEFDSDDLQKIADEYGVPLSNVRPHDTLFGELQNFGFGSPWIEQIEEVKS